MKALTLIWIVVLATTSILLNTIALPLLDIVEALSQISLALSNKAKALREEIR